MTNDVAKLLLRLSVGVLLLFHGWAKINHGVGFIEGLMANYGIPKFFAYVVYLGEVLAPIMLIIGVRVKVASILVMATMGVAFLMVHLKNPFSITSTGALGIENLLFFFIISLCIYIFGGGKYGIDKK